MRGRIATAVKEVLRWALVPLLLHMDRHAVQDVTAWRRPPVGTTRHFRRSNVLCAARSPVDRPRRGLQWLLGGASNSLMTEVRNWRSTGSPMVMKDFTVLQPAVFMQNLERNWDEMVNDGRLSIPNSVSSKLCWVDYRDVAEVAAMAMIGDELGYGTFELCAPG